MKEVVLKKDDAVSPIIGTILLVAITVTLVASLYTLLKDTFVVPENFRNLRETITAYSVITDKIRTTKATSFSAFSKRLMSHIFPRITDPVIGPIPGMLIMT